jgi:hypothetical protein
MAGDQVGKFPVERDDWRCFGFEKGDLVNKLCKKLRFSPVGCIKTPDSVWYRLFTEINLLGIWPFVKMQYRTSDIKIVGEPVIEMSTYQGLGLETEELVALERDLDGCLWFNKCRGNYCNNS